MLRARRRRRLAVRLRQIGARAQTQAGQWNGAERFQQVAESRLAQEVKRARVQAAATDLVSREAGAIHEQHADAVSGQLAGGQRAGRPGADDDGIPSLSSGRVERQRRFDIHGRLHAKR